MVPARLFSAVAVAAAADLEPLVAKVGIKRLGMPLVVVGAVREVWQR
jgi:hypothetical protein